MVRKLEGYPEEGEVVIATVTKIQYHSIFCNLDEYDKSGMIHISEVAPGRVKSVHEYVREGKTVVCKVLRVDQSKGHIDLSLRRVTEAQKRQKASELKQQQVVEKILEQASAELKTDAAKLQEMLRDAIGEDESLFDTFQQVVEGNVRLVDFGLEKKTADALESLIKDRIAPKQVSIKGAFTITSWSPDGALLVRKAFADIPAGTEVMYAGGGRYTVLVGAKEYKTAEESLKLLQAQVKEALGTDAEVAFERTDKR